ncbi:MAG: DNA-directed DNA polymerase [Candidatus Hepatoplasma vulgare]|nr:MAG: DNA-directed DNA polymerase [Candidatus Hepatoplasma sp.]
MNPNFWVRTSYTFFSSFLSINKIISFAKENNYEYAFIIEKNILYSANIFFSKAKNVGIKAIIGLEVETKNYNKILIPKNYEGYKKLILISSEINTKGDFSLKHIDKNLIEIEKNFPTHSYLNEEDKNDLFLFAKANNIFLEEKNLEKLLTKEEFVKKYGESKLNEINNIANKVNIIFPKIKISFPFLVFAKTKEKVHKILKDKLVKNLQIYLSKNKNLKKDEYLKRVNYEFKIISDMGFEAYFLMVEDIINFAKEQKILVGPGRGSAAGSLIVFLLNITEIDPIKNNLIFERFLNPMRISMPDIDIDFEDTRRDEVLKYIVKKYGYNRVASIITFQSFKAKLALKDAFRLYDINPTEANKVTKLVLDTKNLEESYQKNKEFKYLIESKENYKKSFDFAKKLEGLVRQFSTHAAGLVIANDDIDKFVPIQSGYNENILQTQYSMNYLETNGLIKVDILGLRNLSFINEILERIAKEYKKNIDLKNINFNDENVYKLFSNGNTAGIFQFESPGMIRLLKELKPDKFEDLVASTSLFRPGPIQQISSFIKRKHGNQEIEIIDPSFMHILEDTYGIIVYQEQILQIVQIFAGFDLAKADLFRRAIGKKDDNALKKIRIDFFEGARNLNHKEKIINHVYNLIYEFANYGFNRSHAFAYSIISYQLAYLKTYYLIEFAISLLNSVIGNKNKTVFYISEFNKLEIKIVPSSLKNESFKYSKIDDKTIQIGLEALIGVGVNTLNEISIEKEKEEFIDFIDFIVRISMRSVSHSNIITLIKGGCLDYFEITRNTMLKNLDRIIEYGKLITIKKNGEYIFDYSIVEKPILKEYPKGNYSEFEIDAYGFSLQESTFEKYKNFVKENFSFYSSINEITDEQNKDYIIAGELISLRTQNTKWNKEMAFATLNDGTGKITITFWPGAFSKFKENIIVGNIYVIEGKLDLKINKTIIVKDLKNITKKNETS